MYLQIRVVVYCAAFIAKINVVKKIKAILMTIVSDEFITKIITNISTHVIIL